MALVAEIRQCRPSLVLSVDQEGGRVQRFKEGFTRLPPMQAFWQCFKHDPKKAHSLVKDCGWLMASEVLACGVDISFAPVLDVDESCCAVIAERSFAPDPRIASDFAAQFIAGMSEAGMAATGKHFPGHGSVVEDSHHQLPVDRRSLEDFRARDLIPFINLMQRLAAIMPAHLQVPAVDQAPVGFSKHWLQTILRSELGFKGLIFSDDLSMAAAEAAGDYGDRAEQALAAGCDVVLVCNNRPGAEQVLDRLQQRGYKPDNRLRAMSRKASPTWSALEAHSRWSDTRIRLTSLLQSATTG